MPEFSGSIFVKHNLTKRPTIKVVGPNSFSLIFREPVEKESIIGLKFNSDVTLGFDNKNKLISVFMEILDLPQGFSKEEFNSLLCVLLQDNAYLDPYYIELYFDNYEGVPIYHYIIASTTISLIKNLGLVRIDFDVKKSYLNLERLMEKLRKQ
ncbi:hypothetical protein [Acidianus sp. HS-5]|uniref:hypothetical protein n=1 Tax=Acidianus sp. HS-5 TaxID=2886040 RepID=UPI001F436A1B|nr:hypothetical protein [Acidianus sp. HS-5]BDC17438.1 hypothetical protein HS5_03280 [Acidianus sp. HS-5]